ncbi:MAG: PAS domain S-box protein [Candidatus Pacebacteria bacterium]|nr:PAS domain S-box protein [Candidatus Paceibacterota bacterium]
MKKVSTKISWTRPLWELFFQLTFVSASPASWAVLSLILSKLMSFAHPFMLVYTGTLCSYWADFAAYFAPMTYFDSDTSFYTFVYVFFVLIQLFIALLVYKLYSLWGQLRTNSCPAEYSLSCQTLHVFFLLSAKVLPHISFSAVTYSAYQLLNPGTPFAPYKRLSTWDSVTAQSYVAVVLMLVTSLEILLAGTCFVVFCQDRSVRGVSFWSAGTWYHPMAEIAFILCIKTEFFIDSSVQVGYIIRLLMRLTILIIFALYTKYAHYWIDATEFFFCFLEVELNAFVLMFNMTGWSFDSYASYPVVLIPFGLLACVVRTRVTWRPSLDPPRNEEAAMDSVINLLSLAGSKDYKALTTLTSLLVIHSQRCQIEGCECRTLVIKLVSPSEDSRGLTTEAAMTENTTVYLNENDLPSNITKGAAKEVLTVLIEEFASHASKGEELSTQLAEVDFYYFRNHYSALRQIARVEAGKPRLTVRQRLYNLRRIIAMGFERWEYFEDPEKTLLALEYLRHYHKFLDQIEDSIESTVKFWSIVLEEAPSSSKLSDLGKILFERKYKTTETVGKLSHLASNNIEFLVRYGLFMRLVMHDLIASEQVFQKVVSLNAAIDSTLMGKLAESPFSIFRPDSSVMLIAARLEHTGTATITELNTAVEEVLGYARKDLVGCSVVNLMPPTTAQKHEEYVTKFFRTMKSHNLNIPQARFIKTKEGMYVLCRCLLKFIPKFEKTLQVALFLVPDRRFTCYTSFKHDPTEKRAGAILCVPSTYTVLGFTHEAIGVLRLAEDRVKELLGTFSLFDLFPWMEQKDLMERVFANEGKVIEYRSSRILALNKEAEGGSIDEYVPCSKDDRTLLWARFVVEKVGATSTLISLVVSEVPRDLYKNYAVEEGAEVFYYDARMKTAAMQVLSGDLKLKNCVQHEKVVDEPGKHHGHSPNPARDLNFSDVASVASMNSVGTSTTSSMRKSEGGYEITRELQISSISRQTPTTIKRLAVGIFGMLAAVTTLIVVSAYMSLAEVTRLETRFTLIKEYHNRYKSTMLATDMARIYSCFLIGGSLSSVNRYVRVRNDALSNANEVTRKLLFGQKLTYDEELVGTVDDDYDPITVSFSHALLIVIPPPCNKK